MWSIPAADLALRARLAERIGELGHVDRCLRVHLHRVRSARGGDFERVRHHHGLTVVHRVACAAPAHLKHTHGSCGLGRGEGAVWRGRQARGGQAGGRRRARAHRTEEQTHHLQREAICRDAGFHPLLGVHEDLRRRQPRELYLGDVALVEVAVPQIPLDLLADRVAPLDLAVVQGVRRRQRRSRSIISSRGGSAGSGGCRLRLRFHLHTP